ncbi:MAG: hypothetical protein RMJ43_05625 [Chloroherpetonaceae bacterium]|nr:hypothetical protein [Chthonomonadaceae bacterium]MDW8207295.1 hypothetical protein [Chloroherpetonaceae bacterium]
MKRPGFSFSTFVLVVLLLGAVAWVGSIVNPIKQPEHEHPEQQEVTREGELPKPNAGIARNDSEERKKQQQQELEMRRKMMQNLANTVSKEEKNKLNKQLPMKDPESIDPTPQHFFEQDMGAQGIQRQRAEVDRLKKIYEEQNRKYRQQAMGKAAAIDPAPAAPDAPAAAGKEKNHAGHDHHGHDHHGHDH